MIAFRYRIRLLDPLYYAREGLLGAYTPLVLHGTAINHAITAALGLHPENQPFVMSESNGGMDTPRYSDSRASPHFYFTPAALSGPVRDWTEMAKGDNDGFFFRVEAGESLKASQLHFIPPETDLVGLGLAADDYRSFPQRIRLGSFRGVARLDLEFTESIKLLPGSHPVDHPVDPLVSKALRGISLNLFPYPLVENAVCDRVYQLSFDSPRYGRTVARMAWPADYPEPVVIEPVRTSPSIII